MLPAATRDRSPALGRGHGGEGHRVPPNALTYRHGASPRSAVEGARAAFRPDASKCYMCVTALTPTVVCVSMCLSQERYLDSSPPFVRDRGRNRSSASCATRPGQPGVAFGAGCCRFEPCPPSAGTPPEMVCEPFKKRSKHRCPGRVGHPLERHHESRAVVPLAERFEGKVDRSGEHHVWVGARWADGRSDVTVESRPSMAQCHPTRQRSGRPRNRGADRPTRGPPAGLHSDRRGVAHRREQTRHIDRERTSFWG